MYMYVCNLELLYSGVYVMMVQCRYVWWVVSVAPVCVVMVLADSIHAFSHQDPQHEHSSKATNNIKKKTHTQINIHTYAQRHILRNTYIYNTHTYVPFHAVFQSHPVFFEFDEVSTLPSSHSTGGSDVREEVI